MNEDMLIGVVLLIVAAGLIYVGVPTKAGVSPRFLRFDVAPVLFPPAVLVFLAGGAAELIMGFSHLTP